MPILGIFHIHGMKIHVAFEGVGYDKKINNAKGIWNCIALYVTWLSRTNQIARYSELWWWGMIIRSFYHYYSKQIQFWCAKISSSRFFLWNSATKTLSFCTLFDKLYLIDRPFKVSILYLLSHSQGRCITCCMSNNHYH